MLAQRIIHLPVKVLAGCKEFVQVCDQSISVGPQILSRIHTGSSRPSSACFGILKQTRNGSAPQSTQKESIQLLLIALSSIQRLSKFLSVKYPYYPVEVITDACVNGYHRAVCRSHVAIVSFCIVMMLLSSSIVTHAVNRLT